MSSKKKLNKKNNKVPKEEEKPLVCQAEKFLRKKPEFKRKKKACHNTNIALTIHEDGESYRICRRCWEKIAASNIQWSNEKVTKK